jgi:hypothetical protein
MNDSIFFFIPRFAALACVTFYFWLAFFAVNTFYCFGFLAHEGPCKFKSGVNLSQATPADGKSTHGMLAAAPTVTSAEDVTSKQWIMILTHCFRA